MNFPRPSTFYIVRTKIIIVKVSQMNSMNPPLAQWVFYYGPVDEAVEVNEMNSCEFPHPSTF